MAEHVHCLNMALQTMDYLRSGDRVCEVLDAAEETQRLHHEKFVSLYAESAKIKIHIQRHILESIRKTGANLSCWRGERGLRRQKRIGRKSYNMWHNTLMHDAVRHFLTSLHSPDTFNKIKLTGKPKASPPDLARKIFGEPVRIASTSRRAANEFGQIFAKDIVMWRSGDDVNIATARYFVETVTKEGIMHRALVHMHKRCGLAAWQIEETHKMVIDVEPLRPVPYFSDAKQIHIRIPCV